MIKETILVTGGAGFIGFYICRELAKHDVNIICLDNLNDYYDVNLKIHRLSKLGFEADNLFVDNKVYKSRIYPEKLKFVKTDIEDQKNLEKIFEENKITKVCNLAAQAGVRYSLKNPYKYINTNICGFINILECCRNFNIKKLVYASSSSVYGNNTEVPFKESDFVDSPVSIYAASKKSNELMAYSYSHLYSLNSIGLRFFTVYGPMGRPDMAYYLFTKAIINGDPINVFNYGELDRDFTYIDDICEGVVKCINENKEGKVMHKIYNIGNNKPVKLLDFIKIIEKNIGLKAKLKMLPMQKGDVLTTYADTTKIYKDYLFKAKTDAEIGIKKFIDWYKVYYNINI